jgi:transposase
MPEPFYPSDLTDTEWQILELMLPQELQRGKQREVDFQQVVNAIFYRADNGIKWRAMPIDFPTWQTVYGYYRKWVKKGLWENINVLLVEQVRAQAG